MNIFLKLTLSLFIAVSASFAADNIDMNCDDITSTLSSMEGCNDPEISSVNKKSALSDITPSSDDIEGGISKRAKLEEQNEKPENSVILPFECMSLIVDFVKCSSLKEWGCLFLVNKTFKDVVVSNFRMVRSIEFFEEGNEEERDPKTLSLHSLSSGFGMSGIYSSMKRLESFSKYFKSLESISIDIYKHSPFYVVPFYGMPITTLAIDFGTDTKYISDLRNLPLLNKLDLCFTEALGVSLDGIERLPNLTSLKLSTLVLEDRECYADISAIQKIPSLTELVLQDAYFKTEFAELKFDALERLEISCGSRVFHFPIFLSFQSILDFQLRFQLILDNTPTLKFFRVYNYDGSDFWCNMHPHNAREMMEVEEEEDV